MDFYLEFLNDWLEFIWFLNDGCKASKTDLFLLQEHGFSFSETVNLNIPRRASAKTCMRHFRILSAELQCAVQRDLGTTR